MGVGRIAPCGLGGEVGGVVVWCGVAPSGGSALDMREFLVSRCLPDAVDNVFWCCFVVWLGLW